MEAKETTPSCLVGLFQPYSRIDYFFVAKWLLQQASSIHDISWSDHTAVSLTVEEMDACPLNVNLVLQQLGYPKSPQPI